MSALESMQFLLLKKSLYQSHVNQYATNPLFCLAWDRTTGRVGPPVSSTEIKLVSWEEGKLALLVLHFCHNRMVTLSNLLVLCTTAAADLGGGEVQTP